MREEASRIQAEALKSRDEAMAKAVESMTFSESHEESHSSRREKYRIDRIRSAVANIASVKDKVAEWRATLEKLSPLPIP